MAEAAFSLLDGKILGKLRFLALRAPRRRGQTIDVSANCAENSLSGRTGKKSAEDGNKSAEQTISGAAAAGEGRAVCGIAAGG
jgi:hypothetical protein